MSKKLFSLRNVFCSQRLLYPRTGCPFVCKASLWGGSKSKGSEWSKAVSEAEKVVGYSTSFMSLRYLLSDELANVAVHMRKLVGTKHPLLTTARHFVSDRHSNLQTRGLLVLLMSKAAGVEQNDLQDEAQEPKVMESMVEGIYPSQRLLAEITEMIHTAYLIHQGVVNLTLLEPQDGERHDMAFGNKMAVLSGDFLLANASTGLAELYNTEVVELMSHAIQDMMSSEFSPLKNFNGKDVFPADGAKMDDWELQTFLSSGSLLSKGCQSAMMLAGYGEATQHHAAEYGKNLALAHQLHEDLQPFIRQHTENDITVHPTSAPILLHIQEHPEDTDLIELLNKGQLDYKQVYSIISGRRGLQKAQEACQEYGNKALTALSHFAPSEARTALMNIIKAVVSV